MVCLQKITTSAGIKNRYIVCPHHPDKALKGGKGQVGPTGGPE